MANAEHLAKFRESQRTTWNAFREKNPRVRPDLSGADLSEANLFAWDLNGAYLIEAILRGSNLTAANLQWTDLSEADLTGATLCSAKFGDARLFLANLEKADLNGC